MSYFGIVSVCTGKSPTTVNVTSSTTQLAAANTSRVCIYFLNTSQKDVFLGFGVNAEADKGVRLVRNEAFIMDSTAVDKGQINAIAESGTSAVLVQEWDAS